MRQKQYRRVVRTKAEPQLPRIPQMRTQGAVGLEMYPLRDSKEARSEQAQSQDFYENALLLACIALAIFAVWMVPVADTRFF